MKSKSQTLFTVVTALALLLSACQANISRNNDGSLTVETNLSQQELQEAINASIADPLVRSLTVSFQSGYALVNGQRQHLNDASKTDDLSFRLDLGVNNGQLTATISNAELDGNPIEKD